MREGGYDVGTWIGERERETDRQTDRQTDGQREIKDEKGIDD